MKLPDAEGICKQCMKDTNKVKVTSGIVNIYCEHNQAGALMPFVDGEPVGLWQIFVPITLSDWYKCAINTLREIELNVENKISQSLHEKWN